ncbi:hypothetical protein OF001_U460002 [Pseudomonas sp. OF001]|nr:hypothetical protein OF001_U460002 [Pseudomonas sp. OF001]
MPPTNFPCYRSERLEWGYPRCFGFH